MIDVSTAMPLPQRGTLPVCSRRSRLPVLACWLLLLAAGCHQAAYRATSLPLELAAPPIRSARQLDLTGMSRPIAATDLVQPGDVLEVSVSTGLEERYVPKYTVRVGDDGAAGVPLVGPVRLAGLQLNAADYAIYQASVERGIYRNPNVSVELKKRAEHRVTVAGAVKKPGVYPLPPTASDLLSAIVAAGGFDVHADTIVDVRQPRSVGGGAARLTSYDGGEVPEDWVESQIDLSEIQQYGPQEMALGDGAVITVRERPPQTVYVLGKVKRPSRYDMPDGADLRLLDALAMAGGREMEIADKVYVVRQTATADQPVLIEASVAEAKRNPAANLRLAAGDVVSVEETPMTMVLGTASKFIRWGVSSTVPVF